MTSVVPVVTSDGMSRCHGRLQRAAGSDSAAGLEVVSQLNCAQCLWRFGWCWWRLDDTSPKLNIATGVGPRVTRDRAVLCACQSLAMSERPEEGEFRISMSINLFIYGRQIKTDFAPAACSDTAGFHVAELRPGKHSPNRQEWKEDEN